MLPSNGCYNGDVKKLHTFSYWERPQAGMLREVLANEGIDCLIRNDQLASAMGEIPFTECFPELWVIDDEVYPRARLLLKGWLKGDDPFRPSWECPGCGEMLEGHFNACWSCGRQRD